MAGRRTATYGEELLSRTTVRVVVIGGNVSTRVHCGWPGVSPPYGGIKPGKHAILGFFSLNGYDQNVRAERAQRTSVPGTVRRPLAVREKDDEAMRWHAYATSCGSLGVAERPERDKSNRRGVRPRWCERCQPSKRQIEVRAGTGAGLSMEDETRTTNAVSKIYSRLSDHRGHEWVGLAVQPTTSRPR